MSRPVILLVEDDPEDVRFFKRAAEKAGLDCRLVVAEDGQIAVDRLSSREDGPTHVLLDLKLPRKSGLEVLEWIRSHSTLGKTPVIVLTSSEVQSDLQRAHGLGVDAYLVKPLTSAELEGVVRRIADRWNIGPGAPD